MLSFSWRNVKESLKRRTSRANGLVDNSNGSTEIVQDRFLLYLLFTRELRSEETLEEDCLGNLSRHLNYSETNVRIRIIRAEATVLLLLNKNRREMTKPKVNRCKIVQILLFSQDVSQMRYLFHSSSLSLWNNVDHEIYIQKKQILGNKYDKCRSQYFRE